MTMLEKVRTMTKATISPDEAAQILNCSPNTLRLTAKTRPEGLGFPVMLNGNRVRIPRIPLLKFLGEEVPHAQK